MNKQNINKFYRMEREFYRKMKNSSVLISRLLVTYYTVSKEEKYSAIKDVKSITDIPFLDDQICMRINILVNPKRNRRYKYFNKILKKYLYKKCLEEGYEYRYNHDGINQITSDRLHLLFIVSGYPYFIFTKVGTSMKILNQLE